MRLPMHIRVQNAQRTAKRLRQETNFKKKTTNVTELDENSRLLNNLPFIPIQKAVNNNKPS